MKKTKLILCSFLLSVFLLLVGFSGVKTKATGLTTDANLTVVGASVRTVDPMGLKFVASTGEYDKTKVTAYGVVMAFGETADLNEFVIGGKVNGKTVANGEVTATNEENGNYALTLIGSTTSESIAEFLYAQKISARAYVRTADGVVYGETVTTRSLLECALAAKNEGNPSPALDKVLKYVDDNYVLVGKNANNNLSVKSDLFEINYKNLFVEFMNDWNNLFAAANISEQTNANDFAKLFGVDGILDWAAINANYDLTNSNGFKFFTNADMKAKWNWLLDYMKSFDKTINVSRQIKAIQNGTGKLTEEVNNEDGTSTQTEIKLYCGEHLAFNLYNFFHASNAFCNFNYINDFTTTNLYDKLAQFANKPYVNLDNYELYKINDTLTLDNIVPDAGYEFKGYTVNDNKLEGFNYKLENKNVEIIPIIDIINYNITFMDGENVLTSEIKSYTVNDEIILPVINKEGASFMGWYDNKELAGEAITVINAGQTGNKTYYAKYETAKTVKVTFDYNDALTNTEIVQLFVDDVKAATGCVEFLDPSNNPSHNEDLDFKPMSDLLDANVLKPEFKAKWQWLLDYMGDSLLSLDTVPWANTQYGPRVKQLFELNLTGATLNSTIYALTQSLRAFRDSTKYDEGTIKGYDFKTDSKGFNVSIPAATKTTNKTVTLVVGANIEEVPTKVGYTFDGWYNGDVKVETVPETDVTLVAKWVKAQ